MNSKYCPAHLAIIGLLFLSACASTKPRSAVELRSTPGFTWLQQQGERVARERLFTFASDEMEGREAGTRGERLAAEFIAGHLSRAGVLPAGDSTSDGYSYFQTFKIQMKELDLAKMRLSGLNGKLGEPQFLEDWATIAGVVPGIIEDTLETVFVGYGQTDSQSGQDDYQGLHVEGKLVAIAYHERSNQIVSNAVKHGAAGILLLTPADSLGPWQNFVRYATYPTPTQEAGQGLQIPYLVGSPVFSARLLEAMGAPDTIMDDLSAGKPVTPILTPINIALQLTVKDASYEARNVVGYLPGASKPEMFVALGAHYDHEGIKNSEVYNGADDNGSGTITILNVAESFAKDRAEGFPTHRSLLFVFHTAEEKGLIGSSYFTSNPGKSIVGDISRIVAHINMDMVGREARDSIYVVGAYRLSSGYGAIVDSLNQVLGAGKDSLFHFDRKFDAPDDPERIYYRSDHYNYARYNIPIVFFYDGMGTNWRRGSVTDDYHRPTDDPEKIDYVKMSRIGLLTYAIARTVALAPEAPPVDRSEPTP